MRHASLVLGASVAAMVAIAVGACAATPASPSPRQAAAAAFTATPTPYVAAPPSTSASGIPRSSASEAAPPASSATSAAADGLILFGITVPDQRTGSGTYCTTFHTIRPDGTGEREVAGGCLPYAQANWSPTGDGMIIDSHPLSSSTTQVSEAAIDGGVPRLLLTLSGGVFPAFSPDGSELAYEGDESAPGTGSLFIAAADGTHPRQLTSSSGGTFDLWPRFSPDGSRLVFTRMTDETSELWLVNTAGTDLHRLTAVSPVSQFARWSSDGTQLLFTGSQSVTGSGSPATGLWSIDADGTGLTRVSPDTGGRGRDHFGDWSPDGSRIVYTHFEPETNVRSLRVMNADGSGITTLLSNSEGQTYQYELPDWGLPHTGTP